MGKLVEEVVFRATHFRSEVNLDYYTIANMANHSIYELMTKTLPYKDWAYITTISVHNAMLLPREFLRPIRVVLDNNGRNVEARYSTPLEVARVEDGSMGVVHNFALGLQPVYTLWGGESNDPNYEQPQLYIYLYPETLQGVMDCYVAPAFNYDENYQVPIPYEYEELVILSTLWRVLQRLGLSQESNIVFQSIAKTYQEQIAKLAEKKMTEAMNLDKFVFPVPPYQEVQDLQFNSPRR